MEGLIELVAASFARYGIEPTVKAGPSPARGRASSPLQTATTGLQDAAESVTAPVRVNALPEHNYRKNFSNDPAP